MLLSTLLLRSLHISQTRRSHNNWRNERRAFEEPV